MRKFNQILPQQEPARKWAVASIIALIAGLLSVWGIYAWGEYGIALFLITPLFIGTGAAILYGYKKTITPATSFQIGLLALGIFSGGLLLFAIEGIICLVMAAPIGLFLTWVGSLIGYAIVKKSPDHSSIVIILFIISIPLTAFFEKNSTPPLLSVTTELEIEADPKAVWKNVIAFPPLEEPTELLFKMGIAYPIHATMMGSGVGAIRHCNFTTGSFVEPITVWQEPFLLGFEVLEQPEPMKELSFWDVNAPHLHDYFISKRGQFKLILLQNGNTLLQGTTWYYHNIKPAIYWRLWSDYIIHAIHKRVLTHIKKNAEAQTL